MDWKCLTHCVQTPRGWDPQEASVCNREYQSGKSRSELETEDAHFLTRTAQMALEEVIQLFFPFAFLAVSLWL